MARASTQTLVVTLLILVAAALLPLVLKPYGVYLLSLWTVWTIAAIGLNLTLGYAGQVSLAQASFVGIGAYCVALLAPHGFPFGVSMTVGAVLSFLVGWGLGFPALRVKGHYLAFVTLAFTTLVFLVMRNEQWLTNGIYGINDLVWLLGEAEAVQVLEA